MWHAHRHIATQKHPQVCAQYLAKPFYLSSDPPVLLSKGILPRSVDMQHVIQLAAVAYVVLIALAVINSVNVHAAAAVQRSDSVAYMLTL